MNSRLNAISMMCFSISSMSTGGRLMPSTQADSQGAGQIRPVNSGKLLVDVNILYASSHLPSYTASLNSGMTLPRGQPEWQKGMQQGSEEHTSELQSLMRISYAVFCLKKKQILKYK